MFLPFSCCYCCDARPPASGVVLVAYCHTLSIALQEWACMVAYIVGVVVSGVVISSGWLVIMTCKHTQCDPMKIQTCPLTINSSKPLCFFDIRCSMHNNSAWGNLVRILLLSAPPPTLCTLSPRPPSFLLLLPLLLHTHPACLFFLLLLTQLFLVPHPCHHLHHAPCAHLGMQ